MFKKIISIAFALMFFLSACGNDALPSFNTTEPATSAPNTATGKLPTLTGEWIITMTHSGGIMGLMRSIEITSTGSYIVRDERGKQNITGKMTSDELTELVQLVSSSVYSPNKEQYGCADCFIYNVVIQGNGEKFSAQVDDITIERSGLAPLVNVLRNIIEMELKK